MMKNYILCLVLFFIAIYVWEIDYKDRTHPYGTDDTKNKKYYPNFKGEDYGVSVFWGKPDKKDTIRRSLDKIQWLFSPHKDEIIWRRVLFFSIIIGIIFYISEKQNILFYIAVLYIGFYQIKMYEKAHISAIKSKYIDRNILSIKRKLKLEKTNFLKEIDSL
jgi:hypothetical protein